MKNIKIPIKKVDNKYSQTTAAEKEFKAAFRRKADEAKNDAVNEALANDFPELLAA